LRPNFLILITDQQRAPRHWPDEPGWADALMPADAELRRTGLTFTDATCNTCMCTPSRATLLTGLMPAEHGCTLTLTAGGAEPRLANVPGVLRRAASQRGGGVDPVRGMRNLARTLTGLGAGHGPEPELRPDTPNLAHRLRALGYEVGLRGKWHLTRPLAGRWGESDAVRLEQEFGFAGWVPPDAGEDILPEHFGGGTANWDEHFTRQAVEFLAAPPEPFALVVSLVNPHDVLAYPSSYRRGGYDRNDWADLDVPLPPTFGEDLSGKPMAHRLQGIGQGLFIGALADERAARDYLNFYAHLHRVVDRHIGRIVAALGDELRSRTVVVRVSDHGEMGLAHGGMRQKMFNAYEETLRVPLTFSNPAMFPRAMESSAPASLIDVLPTVLSLAGGEAELPGADLSPILRGETALVQDFVRFSYDDHQAGTARADVVPPPNRVRAIREPGWKYATYVDPNDRAGAEHELYDLEADPDETDNLVDVRTGEPRTPVAREALERLRCNL
jgi:arylsulfatase A-like enzyme